MPADVLASQGARVSAGMVLTQIAWSVLLHASEGWLVVVHLWSSELPMYKMDNSYFV